MYKAYCNNSTKVANPTLIYSGDLVSCELAIANESRLNPDEDYFVMSPDGYVVSESEPDTTQSYGVFMYN